MCNCELCQVGRKSIPEQFAYHYACYKIAKSVLKYLEKANIKWSYSKMTEEPEDYLNTLACVMDDACASGIYLDEIIEKHPEYKNWIKDNNKE